MTCSTQIVLQNALGRGHHAMKDNAISQDGNDKIAYERSHVRFGYNRSTVLNNVSNKMVPKILYGRMMVTGEMFFFEVCSRSMCYADLPLCMFVHLRVLVFNWFCCCCCYCCIAPQ